MRFVTLVTLTDGAGRERFVYGNALPHRSGLRETSEWRSLQRVLGSVKLNRYTAALGEDAFTRVQTTLLTGDALTLALMGEIERSVTIRSSMVARGAVRARRADFERLTPIIHQDEDHSTLWTAEPAAFFDDLLSSVTGPPEQRAIGVRRFARALSELVPVPFDGGQFWRVGCFEVIECVVLGGGDDDVRIDLLNNREPLGLRIELRGAVAEIASHLRVRVDGGIGGKTSQRVLDRIIPMGTTRSMEVDLPEAGINFYIEVYGGVDGRCVSSRSFSRITGLSMSVSIGPEAASLHRLPTELAQYVRAGSSQSRPGISHIDPWTTAQATALAFERRDFPPRAPGFYMVHEPAEQRELIRAFLVSAGAGAITIADPYFDDEALRLHLVGRRDIAADLIIVTSLDDDTRSHEAESPRSEPARATVVSALPNSNLSLRDLLDAAEEHHNDLPRRLRIINVASREAGRGQQFHDRFIRVRSATNDILWWLGNSLNSAGTRRYPLFAAEVPGQQRIEFAEYVRLLGEGQVPGRPEARATTEFTNRWTYEPPAPVSPDHPEMQAFPGWERVLTILGSAANVHVDASNEAAINASVVALRTSGMLADNRPHPSWGVCEERRSDVSFLLADLMRGSDDLTALTVDLATWAYHGGIQGNELLMNCRTVAKVLRVAHDEIERVAAADPPGWSFTPSSFEDAIDRAMRTLERSDLSNPLAPLLAYVRDVAIANAPSLYWRFVARERRDRVYASVTGAYDWSAILSADPRAFRGDVVLVAQAVGVFLQTREIERAREVIRAARLSPVERTFGLTKVLVFERGPLEEAWPVLQSTWSDVSVSELVVTRLARLLGRHPELLARFVEAHPESPQLRTFLIESWTRQLPLRGQPAPDRGRGDAYQAAQPSAADIATRQFLLFERAAQQFNRDVLERLDLTELTRPFARELDYNGWRETGAAGARALFVGCRIAELAADGADLVTPLANLAGHLNRNRWGDVSHDLVAVNAAIALARLAEAYPSLRSVVDELLITPSVPAHVRTAVALWLDDDAPSIEARTANIDLDEAIQPFLTEQRTGIVSAFMKRLEAVAPGSPMLTRLMDLRTSPNQDAGPEAP